MAVDAERRTRGGDAVLRALVANGVDTIFGIPGVHTLDIYDALIDEGNVNHILARHEQGAGYMADGYARATGKPGVALIVTGPGITNASTAIGQAYADSAPVFMIATNQERRHLDKMVGNLHEMTDQMSVSCAPIVKWSKRRAIAARRHARAAIDEAFAALGNRSAPGRCYLEIPDRLCLPRTFDFEPEIADACSGPPDDDVPPPNRSDQASDLIAASSRVMHPGRRRNEHGRSLNVAHSSWPQETRRGGRDFADWARARSHEDHPLWRPARSAIAGQPTAPRLRPDAKAATSSIVDRHPDSGCAPPRKRSMPLPSSA